MTHKAIKNALGNFGMNGIGRSNSACGAFVTQYDIEKQWIHVTCSDCLKLEKTNK